MAVDEVVDGGILPRNAGDEDAKDANGVVAISLGMFNFKNLIVVQTVHN